MEVEIDREIKREIKMLDDAAQTILAKHGSPNARLMYVPSEIQPFNRVPQINVAEKRKDGVVIVSKVFDKRGNLGRQFEMPMEEHRELSKIVGERGMEMLVAAGRQKNPQAANIQDQLTQKALQHMNLHSGEKLMEFGPGEGKLIAGALKAGAAVLAVDRSSAILAMLKRKFRDAVSSEQLQIVDADYLDLPNHPSWHYGEMDHLASLFATEKHLYPRALFKMAHAALKKGGKFTIVEATPFYNELAAHLKRAGFNVEKVQVGKFPETVHPLLGRNTAYYTLVTATKR